MALLAFAALIVAFDVIGYYVLPGLLPLALLAATVGSLTLVDGTALRTLPVPLPLVVLWQWMILSLAWSHNRGATEFALQRDIPLTLTLFLAAGVATIDDLAGTIRWTIRVSIPITIGALILLPDTRQGLDLAGVNAPLEGWHGLFPHKNVLGPFLAFAAASVLAFECRRFLRYGLLASIAVLLIGSASITGQIGAIVGVVAWFGLGTLRRLRVRDRFAVALSSLGGSGLLLLLVVPSLDTLATQLGRDPTLSGRTLIWGAAGRAWAQRPVLGFGLNGILFDQPLTANTASVWREIGFEVPHAHNGLLDVGVQLGLVGVTIFAVLLATTFIGAFRSLTVEPTVASWVIAVMTAQLFMSLAEDVFLSSGWLTLLVVFSIVVSRLSDRRSPSAAIRHPAGGSSG